MPKPIRLNLDLDQIITLQRALSFYLLKSTEYDMEQLARIRLLHEYLEKRRTGK